MSLSGRILLLGASGQLGQTFLEQLSSDTEVHACSRQSSPPVFLQELDALERLVEELRPDWVINAAAWTDVAGAEKHPQQAFLCNAKAPEVLARVAARTGAHLVHFSTDYVFGEGHSEPILPATRPNPLNIYGHSKAAGEKAILESGATATIIRSSWLYSPVRRNFVKTIVSLLQQRSREEQPEPLRVVDDQWGVPTSTEFLVRHSLRWLEKLQGGSRTEGIPLLHIVPRGATTWYRFAMKLQSLLPGTERVSILPISSQEYDDLVQRPSWSVLEVVQTQEILGEIWSGWEEELENWWKQFGEGLLAEIVNP